MDFGHFWLFFVLTNVRAIQQKEKYLQKGWKKPLRNTGF